MDNLTIFLRNNLSATMGFGNIISMMHLRVKDDGNVETRISADDGSVHHLATAYTNLELDENVRGCFSNLKYLSQIIDYSVSSPKLTYWERNDKQLISSMSFYPNKKTELIYKATDPFRASIIKPGSVSIEEWPILFSIDKDALTEITNIRKVIQASGDKHELMEVIYNDGNITLEFGSVDRDYASLELEVPAESTTGKSVAVTVAIDQFIRGVQQSLNQVTDDEASVIVEMCDRAIRLTFTTELAVHTTTIIRRKRDDE